MSSRRSLSFFRRSKRRTIENGVLKPYCKEAEEPAALTELYRGGNPVIDIVAVHGINGDAIGTWATADGKRLWLSDPDMLPRDLKDCRVLSFSYPASVATVLGRTSSDCIMQHAHTLVAELVADRELEQASDRPIVFLCHSLGGIIVKRALAYSNSRTSHKIEHIHSIYVSTYGILFFGTPHHGTDKIALATYAQRLVKTVMPSKLVDTDSQLLDALSVGTEVLHDINDNFAPLTKRYHIFYFWEQEKTNFGVKWDYVVTESSAAPIVDGADRAGLRYDHRGMCRFASRTAPGYRLVLSTLLRYSRDAPGVVSKRWREEKDILRSMRIAEARELHDDAQDDTQNQPAHAQDNTQKIHAEGNMKYRGRPHGPFRPGGDADMHEGEKFGGRLEDFLAMHGSRAAQRPPVV